MNTKLRIYPIKVQKLNMVNICYIVVDQASKQAAIIDPAWELETITAMVDKLNVHLTKILLTHSHYDHINMVQPLVKQWNPQVYISAKEANYYNFKCNNLVLLQDLSEIHIGSIRITSFLTPGHTVGSMCYLLADHLFTGDTIFIEGCGMCSCEGGSAEDMFESIQRIKHIIRPEVCIYPGHCYGKQPGYSLAYLMKKNIYFSINKKEQFIQFRMRKNQNKLFAFR